MVTGVATLAMSVPFTPLLVTCTEITAESTLDEADLGSGGQGTLQFKQIIVIDRGGGRDGAGGGRSGASGGRGGAGGGKGEVGGGRWYSAAMNTMQMRLSPAAAAVLRQNASYVVKHGCHNAHSSIYTHNTCACMKYTHVYKLHSLMFITEDIVACCSLLDCALSFTTLPGMVTRGRDLLPPNDVCNASRSSSRGYTTSPTTEPSSSGSRFCCSALTTEVCTRSEEYTEARANTPPSSTVYGAQEVHSLQVAAIPYH